MSNDAIVAFHLQVDNPDNVLDPPVFDQTDTEWMKLVENVLDALVSGEYAATRTFFTKTGEITFDGTIRLEGGTSLTWYENHRTD